MEFKNWKKKTKEKIEYFENLQNSFWFNINLQKSLNNFTI